MVSNFAICKNLITVVNLTHRTDVIFEVKMSNKNRFLDIVSHAVIDLTAGDIDGTEVWASATAVGENAEVSTATARKHLEILVEQGHVERKTFMGISGYRVKGGIDPRA